MPIRLREKCREIAREAGAGGSAARVREMLEDLDIPADCPLARMEADDLLALAGQIEEMGDRGFGLLDGGWGSNPESLRLWLIHGLQSRLPEAIEEWHYRERVSRGIN